MDHDSSPADTPTDPGADAVDPDDTVPEQRPSPDVETEPEGPDDDRLDPEPDEEGPDDDGGDPDEGYGHAQAPVEQPGGTLAPTPAWSDWLRPAYESGARFVAAVPTGVAIVGLVAGGVLHEALPAGGARVLGTLTVVLLGLLLVAKGCDLTSYTTVRVPTRGPGAGRLAGAMVVRRGGAEGRLAALLLTAGVVAGLWAGPGQPVTYVFLGAAGVVLLLHTLARTSVARLEVEAWYRTEEARTADARKIRQRWATGPGARRPNRGKPGPLAGSDLGEVEPLADGGWRATVKFPDDTTATWETLDAERGRIAKRFGADRDLVFSGPCRSGQASRGVLLVHRSDPLAAPVPWRGPSLTRHGRVVVGRYADGSDAAIHLWRGRTGIRHGLVAGATGSGKSSPLGQLLVEARLSRRVFTVLLDAGGGHGIKGGDVDHVDHLATTPEGITLALRAVVAVLRARTAAGLVNRVPTRSYPMLLVELDEAPNVLMTSPRQVTDPVTGEKRKANLAVEYVSEITRTGRKVNVAIIPAVQQPTLDQLGGESALRAQMTAGNTWGFRITDAGGKGVLPGVAFRDLDRIPEGIPGLGHIPGEAQNPMRARAVFVDDQGLAIADQLDKEAGPRVVLDKVSAAAWASVMGTTDPEVQA